MIIFPIYFELLYEHFILSIFLKKFYVHSYTVFQCDFMIVNTLINL